jgi:hypothetical protein
MAKRPRKVDDVGLKVAHYSEQHLSKLGLKPNPFPQGIPIQQLLGHEVFLGKGICLLEFLQTFKYHETLVASKVKQKTRGKFGKVAQCWILRQLTLLGLAEFVGEINDGDGFRLSILLIQEV